MIRVLQVLGTVGLGGAESRVMDLYRHMDRSEIQFDFLVTQGTGRHYEEEIKNLGGKIYYLPRFRVINIGEYKKACREFFETHKGEYAAVHGHMTSTAAVYLPIAKKAGVPLTIAHARSAGVDPGIKGKITRFMRRNLYKRCDMMLSCSDEASVSAFGQAHAKDVKFMPNAIDTKDFIFDASVRTEIRAKHNLDDRFIIGHVGSFRYAKNHEFLVELFANLLKEWEQDNLKEKIGMPRPVLMLLGDGELRSQIEEKVERLGISADVIFTGNIAPVAPYYQAFDMLIFPSHYEGMPGTVVEAQAAGLPCIISDKITPQVGVTDLVTYMSLDVSMEEWISAILEKATSCRTPSEEKETAKSEDRQSCEEKFYDSRMNVKNKEGLPLSETLYDVNEQVKYYRELYIGDH